MISIENSIRHMAWANHRMLTEVASLPTDCLQATYGPKDWTVARIAMHMAGSNEWFRFILTGQEWTDLQVPTTAAELLKMRDYIDSFTEVFLAQAALADDGMAFEDETGPHIAPRSIVLAQAVYHSTEHRTHMATAIEVQGISKINLDDYDVWGYFNS